MQSVIYSSRPQRRWVYATARGLRRRRAAFVVTISATVAASLACSQRVVTSNESSYVSGAIYQLRAVDQSGLPARFIPLDDPQLAPAARIDSGRIAFHADRTATGEWYGTGEQIGLSRVFKADYVENGAQVLLYTGEGTSPDTADISDNTMTIRAQFFRPLSRERYVVVMIYARVASR